MILLAMVTLAFAAQTALEQGVASMRRGDYAGAEAALRKAVSEQPSNARALVMLGHALAYQQKLEEAEAPFRRACDLHSLPPISPARFSAGSTTP